MKPSKRFGCFSITGQIICKLPYKIHPRGLDKTIQEGWTKPSKRVGETIQEGWMKPSEASYTYIYIERERERQRNFDNSYVNVYTLYYESL
jgi:hypothetical protein